MPIADFPTSVQVLLLVAGIVLLIIVLPTAWRMGKAFPLPTTLVFLAGAALTYALLPDRLRSSVPHHKIPRQEKQGDHIADSGVSIAEPPFQSTEPTIIPREVVIQIKSEVRPQKLDSALMVRLPAIVATFRSEIRPSYNPVMTSANDSEEHHAQSAHYRNQAVDFRANDLNEREALKVRDALRNVLGPKFLVLLEFTGTQRQHLHIQLR